MVVNVKETLEGVLYPDIYVSCSGEEEGLTVGLPTEKGVLEKLQQCVKLIAEEDDIKVYEIDGVYVILWFTNKYHGVIANADDNIVIAMGTFLPVVVGFAQVYMHDEVLLDLIDKLKKATSDSEIVKVVNDIVEEYKKIEEKFSRLRKKLFPSDE